MRRALVGVVLACILTGRAAAQDRPPEEELFGAPAQREEPAPPPSGPRTTTDREPSPAPERAGRTEPTEPEPGAEGRLRETLSRTRDTLDLGGQLYLRAFAFSRKGDAPSTWELTAPSLLDLYLDARPSDRVRAFVLARTQYDPTAAEPTPVTALPVLPAAVDPSAIPGARARKVTEVALDQLWLSFDAGRRAFFTAGKQHVKWGVGRFWNPTDFLHAVRRDPLAPFDVRTGTTMLRLQIPWEARGWSFQTAVIAEPLVPAQDASSPRAGQLGALGGAARAELVLGSAELGVGGVVQKGRPSRLGVDLSGPVGELDAYGELALRSGPELRLWREVPGVDPSLPITARFAARGGSPANPAATVGASWTRKYGDQDTVTVGAEGFWNRNGYDSARIYPWLLVQNDFTPFYVGRWYAGAYVFLPAPGSWDRTTFTASALANLSDGSLLARLDVAQVVLTYLRFEAFVAGHAGSEGGELRLGLDIGPQDLGGGVTTPRIRVGAPLVDVGVALRVAL
jgi:hypothetical protein